MLSLMQLLHRFKKALWLCAALFISVDVYMIYLYVPLEAQEGIVQKIMYLHIPIAWTAFTSFFMVFVFSILFLWKKERIWDIYASSSAEVGMIFCTLVLITGPIWARPIWGVWWTWDSRLTLTLILWFIFASYLMLRNQGIEASLKAKYSAVLGIVGFLDVPLIHFSVLWWRTIHPKPKMLDVKGGIGSGLGDPSMIITLCISIVTFFLIFLLFFLMKSEGELLRDDMESLRSARS